MKLSTKKITTIAMLAAIAMVLNMLIHVPLVPAVSFMKYDPKDIIIVISGFIYGPLEAILISLITSSLELFLRGDTITNLIMNVISTCSFACVAAFVYRLNHTKKGAMIGLLCGVISVTIIMCFWNYIVTPIIYQMPHSAILSMMPAIILFNFLKSSINAVFTFLLYKPVVTIFRKSSLVEKENHAFTAKTERKVLIGFVFITIICVALVVFGII